MKTLLIKGASLHGCVVAEAAAESWSIVGFVDVAKGRPEALALAPLLGHPDDLPEILRSCGVENCFVAIGDNHNRKVAVARTKLRALNLRFPSIVHPTAIICRGATIGEGALICAGAVVGVGAKVGAFAIVNTRASLDHHSTLGDYASMAPASATGGNAHIGEGTAIGMGVMMHHGVTVGPWSVVGSSSLVNKDLPGGVVACGQAARIVRERKPGERYL